MLLLLLFSSWGLTGIWLNFAGTSALAGLLAGGVLLHKRKQLARPDEPVKDGTEETKHPPAR